MATSRPPFAVQDRFIVRSPLLPQDAFVGWLGRVPRRGDLEEEVTALRRELAARLEDPAVREALFVASPSLYEAIPRWLESPDSAVGLKAERAIVRYVTRMSARSTPFGLFSAVSVGRCGPYSQLELRGRSEYSRTTRLDRNYVAELCDALSRDSDVIRHVPHVPCTSLYESAGRIRYAAASELGGARVFTLAALECDEAIDVALAAARDGATPPEIVEALLAWDPEVDREDAEAFVEELRDHGALELDLAPPITGPDPMEVLDHRMARVQALAEPRAKLRVAADRLRAVDAAGIGVSVERYRELAAALAELPATQVPGKLFQVDLYKRAEVTLGPQVRRTLAEAVEVLHRISASPEPPGLARFRDEFTARFEMREVPLTLALDADAGVGFEISSGPAESAEPLLVGLAFPPPKTVGGRRCLPQHEWLMRRIAALPPGERCLVLDDADLEALSPEEPPLPLPDAFAVMGVLEATDARALDRGEFTFHLQGSSGPSGARMLGRFCHLDPEVRRLVDEHIAAEERASPDVVFAEVVHLSEGRAGNVVCRPVLRSHEIEFMGQSGASPDQRIPLEDLWVSVRDKRIVLRSRRLGKEVMPRLSSAHAYGGAHLPTYRFLCALQDQGVARTGWHWGPLQAMTFLPRVCWGNVAFTRARWRLDRSVLAPVFEAAHDKTAQASARRRALLVASQGLRRSLGLPRFVELSDGDNHLAIDFDNILSVESFAHSAKRRASVELRELVPAPGRLALRGPDGGYAHELCLPFVRSPEKPATTPARAATLPVGERARTPGGDWLYTKIYCGPADADRILRSVVAPLTRELRDVAGVDRWFFLRYADPRPHLRVRWHGHPNALLMHGLPRLRELLEPWVSDGGVSRLQVDTYEPEYERYGGAVGVDASERVFTADSDAVLAILANVEGDHGLEVRWQLALCSIDTMFDQIGMDLDARRALIAAAREAFHREFGVDTAFLKSLSGTFRRHRRRIDTLLVDPPGDEPALVLGLAAIGGRAEVMREAIEAVHDVAAEARSRDLVDTIVRGWIHMCCNRILRSAQRAQEVVIYDLLFRHYDSRLAQVRRGRPGAAHLSSAAVVGRSA